MARHCHRAMPYLVSWVLQTSSQYFLFHLAKGMPLGLTNLFLVTRSLSLTHSARRLMPVQVGAIKNVVLTKFWRPRFFQHKPLCGIVQWRRSEHEPRCWSFGGRNTLVIPTTVPVLCRSLRKKEVEYGSNTQFAWLWLVLTLITKSACNLLLICRYYPPFLQHEPFFYAFIADPGDSRPTFLACCIQ